MDSHSREDTSGRPDQVGSREEVPRNSLIFLVGYRGTGKSTVARLAARRLGWQWIDADEVLEQQAGTTIGRIFGEQGEPGFRQRETEVLEALCRLTNHVVATGGGVVLSAANRHRLKNSGFVVWLNASVETIEQRLQADGQRGDRRPVLTVGGRAEIEQLLRVREPLYQEVADVVVDTSSQSPGEVADQVVQAFQVFCTSKDKTKPGHAG